MSDKERLASTKRNDQKLFFCHNCEIYVTEFSPKHSGHLLKPELRISDTKEATSNDTCKDCQNLLEDGQCFTCDLIPNRCKVCNTIVVGEPPNPDSIVCYDCLQISNTKQKETKLVCKICKDIFPLDIKFHEVKQHAIDHSEAYLKSLFKLEVIEY